MKFLSCALPCAIALFASPAVAADPPSVDNADTTKVHVSAPKYDQRRGDSASTIVVGRAELLQQGDRTLADALARVPGITIRAGAIRMRGLGNGYTQVLLNGVAAPADFAIESLAPELIEKIEIVRTASAALGTQGIAGTINIVLRKSVTRARRSLKLGIDRQRGQLSPAVSGELADKGERHSYTVSATLARTRQINSSMDLETRPGGAGESAIERLTARRERDTVDVVSLAPRLNGTLDDGAKLSAHGVLTYNRRSTEGENHESAAAGGASAIAHSAFISKPIAAFIQWGLDWDRPLASGANLQLEAGGGDSRRRSTFEFAGLPRGKNVNLVAVNLRERGYRLGGKYRIAPAGGHQLLLGWDGARTTRWQTRAGNDLGNKGELRTERYDGVIERAALFIEDDWQVDEARSLSLGLRAEALHTQVAVGGAVPLLVRLRTRVLSPVLQGLYKVGGGRQLRAGLTRTYKAPTMHALIPRRYVVDNNNNETNPDMQGNPALRPEMAWGLDAAFDWYLGKDAMIGASAFVRRIDDVTVRRLERDSDGWLARQANGGRAVASGVLLEARLPLKLLWDGAPAIDTRFSLARNRSRLTDGAAGADTRLDGQEPSSASIGFDYRGAGVTLGASYNYRAGGVVNWSETVQTSAAAVRGLDVFSVWDLGAGMRLRVGAVNLLRRDEASAMRSGTRRTTVLDRDSAGLRLALEYDFGAGPRP